MNYHGVNLDAAKEWFDTVHDLPSKDLEHRVSSLFVIRESHKDQEHIMLYSVNREDIPLL